MGKGVADQAYRFKVVSCASTNYRELVCHFNPRAVRSKRGGWPKQPVVICAIHWPHSAFDNVQEAVFNPGRREKRGGSVVMAVLHSALGHDVD